MAEIIQVALDFGEGGKWRIDDVSEPNMRLVRFPKQPRLLPKIIARKSIMRTNLEITRVSQLTNNIKNQLLIFVKSSI